MEMIFLGSGVVLLLLAAALRLGRTIGWRLRIFLRRDPRKLPVVSRSFATLDLPNIQIAIEQYAQEHEMQLEVIGYTSYFGDYRSTLRGLLGSFMGRRIGPVQYRDVDIGVDSQMQCVERGVFLMSSGRRRIAAHISRDEMSFGTMLELEVMTRPNELAASFIEEVRQRAEQSNVYRGKIISFDPGSGSRTCGSSTIRFHRFPRIDRDAIVLPEATTALIERNIISFIKHADKLRRSGRVVKRGLLFHGRPGTGKTYTAKWLAQSLEGVTVILLTGEQLSLIKECCETARMLAPALVIIEDVDLIAQERDEGRHPFYQVSLHQLLNEVDGLTPESEVIFIFTTNRPESIEPALAARPGRVDQAIEFPLPDVDCRRRLFALYGEGLQLDLDDPDRFVAKTEGASPAFIQELMRKAALIAAEEDSMADDLIRVRDAHLDAALRELVLGGGELTRSLLGFAPENGTQLAGQ